MSRSAEPPQPAASWLGTRQKPVLSVLWENPPSLVGQWAAGHRAPVSPAPLTGAGAVPLQCLAGAGNAQCRAGIRSLSPWAALQTGSAKGELHKHLILLWMVLSLLLFNQVNGWLLVLVKFRSDSMHGENQVFVMEIIKWFF